MPTRLNVNYADGRDVTVLVTPRAQVETERHFSGLDDAQKIEGSYYLAWASLHYSGKEGTDFDEWLNTIIEVTEAEAEVVDPTPETPQPTIS